MAPALRVGALSLLTFWLGACPRPAQQPAPPGPTPSPRAAVAAPASQEPPDAGAWCDEDADCALTRFEPEGCCERLCVPRPVAKAELAALEQARRRCESQRGTCPDPVCPPPRHGLAPACREGRCTALRTSSE